MFNPLKSSAKRTSWSLGRRVVFATVSLVLLACAWPFGCQSPAALGAESPSALEADAKGWVDMLPPADLKGWYRVAVPPTDKVGRQQWHVDPDKKLLVCDGGGGHDMLLCEKEFGDAIFHFECRYVPDEGKAGYNSGAYIRNSRDGAIWHQAQLGDASGGYLFGETPAAGGKATFFTLQNEVKDTRVKPVGEWNTLELTARGKTLTLWVNGAVACEFRDCGLEKGRIGLEGEGYLIEFRNLKVKELR
ncbi:MAG: 3-keto-disaccharide hydrolase [Pirellulaceae bacterium]